MPDQLKSYASLAQRVADSFLHSLTQLDTAVPEDGVALHAFFAAWYGEMAVDPASFGLPISDDRCSDDTENRDKSKKEEISRHVKKIRESIGYGLELLLLVGKNGRLDGDAMVLNHEDWVSYQAKAPRLKKAMLKGFERVGLTVNETADGVVLRNDQYPHMMSALQRLVDGCSRIPDERAVRFHLSRCDFRAQSPEYQPDPDELYRVFSPEEYVRLMALHRYFLEHHYRFALFINDIHGWEVKYQGDRKVKSSPFFHVEYSVRRRNPLCLRLKCASSSRIIPLVQRRSQAVQDDFFRRIYHCRGDECGWCKNQKTLGPSPLQHQGKEYLACWYVMPDLRQLDDRAVELVKEYAEMHAELA